MSTSRRRFQAGEKGKACKKLRVLAIGPLPTAGHAIGGSRTLFAETVRQLELRGFDLDIVNTSRPRSGLAPWRMHLVGLAVLARVMWGVLRRVRRSRLVFLNMSSSSAIGVAPAVWLICKAARRPLALRFFGGTLPELYRGYGRAARRLADRTFLRCPRVHMETHYLLSAFGNPSNFCWLPNTRDIASPPPAPRAEVRRLVFAAQLWMDKGLAEALEACRALPEGCRLNVFGPVMRDTDLSLFEGHPRASYGGVLEPSAMPRVLSEHDLLLFPSYRLHETYPGVIIEASQCGVPVVAAKWGDISEIVCHERDGLLVEPRSAAALQAAIERLLDDPMLYRRLCAGARERGERFRSAVWYDRVAQDLRGLSNARSEPGIP